METFSRCIKQRVTELLFMLLLSFGASMSYAADPDHVSFTLEGCRGDVTLAAYDEDNFICTDDNLYTTGNLGKGWNELDIVPHRLTTDAGNAAPSSQTYTVSLTLDYLSAGIPGYDLLTEPALNLAKSDPSCSISFSGEGNAPDAGDTIIYRFLTVTQDKNSICVIDWAGRLALGSHLYPGSSLHAHTKNEDLNTSGIGNKDVSIPVKEILAQELDKSMTAERDSVKTWSIFKTSNPANISFGDTCEIDPVGVDKVVTVTVNWSVVENPSGEITVVTDITATNPAHRKLLISVTDEVYGDFGSGNVLLPFLTASVIEKEIEANSETPVLHHEASFDQSDLDGLGLDIDNLVSMMDHATATYTDFAFPDVEIPGEVTAEDSTNIESSGVVLNNTAYITDVENISGTGFSFEVDSVVGASGSFTDGDASDGEVTWQSDPQTGAGSVTFTKIINLDKPRNTSGSISDIATIYPSDSASSSDNASSNLSATATSELTIYKSVDVAPSGESYSFFFDVNGGVGTVQVDIADGLTTGSTTISNLAQGMYSVTEQAASGFFIGSTNPQSANLGTALDPICADDVSFANYHEPTVQVIKITDPVGNEAGWQFNLTGPGVNVNDTTDGSGSADFGGITLGEGVYTMTETGQPGWDLTEVTNPDGSTDPAQCTFTVALPADASSVFTCTFENTQEATILIEKYLDGEVVDTGNFGYDTNDDASADFSISATTFVVPDCDTDTQCEAFENLDPDSYIFEELGPSGDFSFVSLSCDVINDGGDGSDDSGTIIAGQAVEVILAAGETVKCRYTNYRAAAPGNIFIEKYIVDGDGSSTVITDRDATFHFATTSVDSGDGEGIGLLPTFDLLTSSGTATTSPLFTNIFAGDHTVDETGYTSGDGYEYVLDRVECEEIGGVTGDPSTGGTGPSAQANISLDDGETIVCRFYNKPLPRLRVIKDLIPDDDSGLFNLMIDGAIEAPAVGDGGDTGWVVVGVGDHSVSESGAGGTLLSDYDSAVSCDNGDSGSGSSLGGISVTYYEDVTCTITNTRKYMIDLLKTFNGLVDDTKDVDFVVYQGPDGFDGTVVASDNTLGDVDGLLEFGGVKLSNLGTYSICELGIPVGTTPVWSLDVDGDGIGDAALSPTLDPDDPEGATYCIAFGVGESLSVGPGETLHLVVDNQRPEGDRRTPGYWKNWNTCSNGNQVETAEKNGGFAEGYWLLDDLVPDPVGQIGEVPIPDCETAVSILDTRSLSEGGKGKSGKNQKLGGYADTTLARALLASMLNRAVPTSDCSPSIDPVIDEANELLVIVGYDAETGQLKGNSDERDYALYLAGILDDFNNNICTSYTLLP